MTKKECHKCIYIGKPKGAKRWWCMVPYSKCPLKQKDGCAWWQNNFQKTYKITKYYEKK